MVRVTARDDAPHTLLGLSAPQYGRLHAMVLGSLWQENSWQSGEAIWPGERDEITVLK